jgi:hypothetical protein
LSVYYTCNALHSSAAAAGKRIKKKKNFVIKEKRGKEGEKMVGKQVAAYYNLRALL